MILLNFWLNGTPDKLGTNCLQTWHNPKNECGFVILRGSVNSLIAFFVYQASSCSRGRITCTRQSMVAVKKKHFFSVKAAFDLTSNVGT